jgi:hypothetical protein
VTQRWFFKEGWNAHIEALNAANRGGAEGVAELVLQEWKARPFPDEPPVSAAMMEARLLQLRDGITTALLMAKPLALSEPEIRDIALRMQHVKLRQGYKPVESGIYGNGVEDGIRAAMAWMGVAP